MDSIVGLPRDYYQAIVLDIEMPIMNGMDACILIQQYLNNRDNQRYQDRSNMSVKEADPVDDLRKDIASGEQK